MKKMIYRVMIQRSSGTQEPAEDYLTIVVIRVGDVIDIWYDSRPRNYRVVLIKNGTLVVKEDT